MISNQVQVKVISDGGYGPFCDNCHAHSFILYILYSVLYILFFIHFILCILPLCCILQYLHCPWSGPDSHFTAGYTISV